MFGLEQAWVPKVKICSDCPSGLQKTKICSDGAIRPRKQPIFVRGLKNKPQNDNETAVCTESLRLSYSASIPSVLLASPDFRRPFLRAPTTAFTPFKTSCTLVYEAINECKKKRPKFYPRYEGTVSAAMSFTNDHCTL